MKNPRNDESLIRFAIKRRKACQCLSVFQRLCNGKVENIVVVFVKFFSPWNKRTQFSVSSLNFNSKS